MSTYCIMNMIACIVSTNVMMIAEDKRTIKINGILAVANGILFGLGL